MKHMWQCMHPTWSNVKRTHVHLCSLYVSHLLKLLNSELGVWNINHTEFRQAFFIYSLTFDRDILFCRHMVLPSRSLTGRIANVNEEDVSWRRKSPFPPLIFLILFLWHCFHFVWVDGWNLSSLHT
jgi:hypothetical protein